MKRLLCAALAALLLLSGCAAPFDEPVPPRVPAAAAAPEAGDLKYVALTFDDGPSPRCTPRLLDGLAEYGARATFFVVGCQTVKDPDIVRRIAAEGHQVGNHSYDHPQLDSLTCAQALDDLQKNDDLLRELLGEGDYWVRPPYGGVDETVRGTVTVPMVKWSVDPRDWESLNADQVVQAVMEAVEPNSIILLHDIYPSSVEAALRLVDRLRQEGYELVTVRELLALNGIEPENGVLYCSGDH